MKVLKAIGACLFLCLLACVMALYVVGGVLFYAGVDLVKKLFRRRAVVRPVGRFDTNPFGGQPVLFMDADGFVEAPEDRRAPVFLSGALAVVDGGAFEAESDDGDRKVLSFPVSTQAASRLHSNRLLASAERPSNLLVMAEHRRSKPGVVVSIESRRPAPKKNNVIGLFDRRPFSDQ